jgi:hypothetical protein
LDWAKSWKENRTQKRSPHEALAEKDSQGVPKEFHIKEEVPDDLPTGEVPNSEVIKLGHDLKCTLTDHFAATALDEPFNFLIFVQFS